jgi:UDP-N-acetylglucosamine:LPS N-acetylglucosamine transferase
VLVLSADVGEGHLAAARAIKEGLEDLGVDVAERDGLRGLGFTARTVIRDGYRLQLRVAPWSYAFLYALFNRSWVGRHVGEVLLSASGGRRLRAIVDDARPDVVVSTHPALTCVLGHERRRRRLDVPLVVPITDLADYTVWAHRGADLHLVMHEDAIPHVERVAGAGSALLVRPLVARRFARAQPRAAARAALDLPADGGLVAVSGGGWGVGDLGGGAQAALDAGAATVVVVCGRNDRACAELGRRFADEARVRVWGYCTRMDELMRAADVLVHSTGGVTSLEALSCGCPTIAYGSTIGHIRVHNTTMQRLGLIDVAADRGELRALLAERLAGSARSPWAPAGDAADAATATAAARPTIRPLPRWRVAAGRAAASLAAVAATVSGLTTDVAYSVTARPLDLRPTTHLVTTAPEAAVVVRGLDGTTSVRAARRLARRGIHVTFAVTAPTPAWVIAALRRAGDDALPALPGGSPVRWLHTRGALAQAPMLGARRLYLAPADGFGYGQYLLARTVHAGPVSAQVRVSGAAVASMPAPARGDVVVLEADPGRAVGEIGSLSARLSATGLSATPLSALLPPPASTNGRSAGEASSATAEASTSASPTAIAAP